MKNKLLKYYIAAFYLCSTFVAFAQPGSDDNGTGLESPDAPAAPIDDYFLLLSIMGIILVFFQFRSLYARKIKRQRRMF